MKEIEEMTKEEFRTFAEEINKEITDTYDGLKHLNKKLDNYIEELKEFRASVRELKREIEKE